jgi:hypothetical protein
VGPKSSPIENTGKPHFHSQLKKPALKTGIFLLLFIPNEFYFEFSQRAPDLFVRSIFSCPVTTSCGIPPQAVT